MREAERKDTESSSYLSYKLSTFVFEAQRKKGRWIQSENQQQEEVF